LPDGGRRVAGKICGAAGAVGRICKAGLLG